MDGTDEHEVATMCANCGKGEEVEAKLKACTPCKLVKYCGKDCQIAHRRQHKNACKRRAAELHDEALFRPPPKEDCPICFLLLPAAGVYLPMRNKIIVKSAHFVEHRFLNIMQKS
jgi:hypothetical protein